MRTLYQFPLSLYCEKARWVLDHKELDYIAQNMTPGVHRLFVQIKTGQHRLPMLNDQKNWIADSTDIAEYLERTYPEHSIFRSDEKLNQKIIAIDALSHELGDHVRRFLFSYVLEQPDKNTAMEIILGEKGILRNLEKISVPTIKFALKKMHQVSPENAQISKQRINEVLKEFNQTLIENGGRYLVGDQLTFADIAVCSMVAPLLMLPSTPWEITDYTEIHSDVLLYRNELLDLPLGQYVKRIYETERNARVDWRGV